jgi:iron complex outermembrane recepter protein
MASKTKLMLSALTGTMALLLASPAMAQVDVGSQTGADQDEIPDPDDGNPATDDVNEPNIIVTGSRVSNGDNMPTPVTIVATEQLEKTTPSNIPDALNKLPVFARSQGQQSGGSAGANNAGNYLNLRGVGVIRSLILFDGHRVPPTAANGAVDINTIPQILIKRVDVVTGGASAVYGSDAVTGVVNFIVDRDFEGFKFQVQGGVSEYKDNGSFRAAGAFGTNFANGRGHFEASLEHYETDGIQTKFDRPYGDLLASTVGNGTTFPLGRFSIRELATLLPMAALPSPVSVHLFSTETVLRGRSAWVRPYRDPHSP